MWGNKSGWITSAAIVVVMALLMWNLSQPEAPPGPSGAFPHMLNPVALPTDPTALVGMTDSCDAGDTYRAAIDLYLKSPQLYDDFYGSSGHGKPSKTITPEQRDASIARRLEQVPKLEALELILKAAPCRQMTLFVKTPLEVVNYNTKEPQLEALKRLGEITTQVATLYWAQHDVASAEKYLRASFALGAKLYAERIVHQELSTGLGLMNAAAEGMKAVAAKSGNPGRGREVSEFLAAAEGYYSKDILPLWRCVNNSAADAETIGRTAGDVFELARNPKADRMWRVEAALRLGLYRFNADRRAHQRGANHELTLLANDPDPTVKAAATAAQTLTLDQYRMYH